MVALLLLVIPCFSGEPGKPHCGAKNRGRFWPEQANTDHAFAKLAGHCGELRMCSRGILKYGWQPLTVHISQLGKARKKREIPGCEDVRVSASALRAPRNSIEESERQPSEGEAGLQVSRP